MLCNSSFATSLKNSLGFSSELSTQVATSQERQLCLEGVALEEVPAFKYLGTLFTTTGQAVQEVESRINSARLAFNRLQAALWSRREISNRVCTVVVRTILRCGCETWLLRVEDRKGLEVFDNGCLGCIKRCNRHDRVPCAVLRIGLQRPTSPTLPLQRRLRWFGHAARRAPGEFMRELFNPDVPRTWHRPNGEQLKTWATTLKEDLVRLIRPAAVRIRRWNKEWASLAMDLAQDRHAWSAAVRGAVNAMDADSAGAG